MNRVILHGRLARSVDVKYSQTGTAWCNLTIACAKYTKDEGRSADYISCKAFTHNAELLGKYFQKGSEIVAEGHLAPSSHKDSEGRTVYTQDVYIDRIEFAGSRSESEREQPRQQSFDDIPDGFTGVEDDMPF